MNLSSRKIAVTGASGHLGQLVLDELIKKGLTDFIAITRNPEKIQSYVSRGVELKKADFLDVGSLQKAFVGVERLLLISTDAVGQRLAQHKNAIDAAKKSGVKHIIYTSWPNPEKSAAGVAEEHALTESLIKKSCLSYTILRNYPYAENLFMSLPSAVKHGTWVGTAGDGKVAFVTRRDCAKIAASVLVDGVYKNRILDVSGPKAFSYNEIACMVKEILDIDFKYVDMSEKDFKNILIKTGLPEVWADLTLSFDIAFKNHEVEKVSSSVKDITGEDPLDIETFLKLHIETIRG